MEKWKLKSFIKISTACFIGMVIFNICGEIKSMFRLLLAIYMIAITGALFIYFFTNTMKDDNEVDSEDYCRDIDEKYTPAMASFMIDNYIEANEAMLATILDLCVKKYFRLNTTGQEVEIEIINNEKDKLHLHEKYIVECIENNELIRIPEFKKLVKQDCEIQGLVYKNRKTSIWERIRGICIIIFLFLYICIVWDENGELPSIIDNNMFTIFIVTAIMFAISASICSQRREYYRTVEGEAFAIRVKGLKNFIREYTLLKEKDIDYINVVDRYLPYSIALEEANKIEEMHIEYNKLIARYVANARIRNKK